ncbi:unnamed protein product (macronuclear) [Paramecium tetraurelia]|uniref:Anaphase-promoting complex subunit 4 WD40 domain-containing protein n=1 Tax=Paramecium tetraurelia TaxID=5888 RepID=A0DB28_PARTE|nr:uncharacterized protein GSPATT00015139001 [Paramecium tetraurelia]CAK80245.1 unnamed protein product [Paramecium tetraurelia]|eukprot:XP_001447642.1 hypothetical protein (macronuclear) [Paramecium tetraurelia strain d4-2]
MQIEQPQIKKQYEKAHVSLHHKQIPYLPSTITALSNNPMQQLLLVGKENGVIEIYSYPTYTQISICCSINSQIRSLFWIDEEHFICAYLSGQISLFNIHDYKPLNNFQLPDNINIYESIPTIDSYFLCACSDGSIRKFDYQNNKIYQIQQSQQLDCQCLSIAINKEYVYASFSNGSIRQLTQKTLLQQQTWQLNISSSKIAKANVIIPWKLCICNNNLFIGSSNGSVIIYETQFNTEIQQIQTHMSDILTLYPNLNNVYVSGVDSKIVCLSYNGSQYQITQQIRGQSHDVYAFEIIKNNILISGGLNTDICYYKLDGNGQLLQQNQFTHIFTIPRSEQFICNHQYIAINKYDSIDLLSYDIESDPIYWCEFKLQKPAHFIKLTKNLLCYGQSDQTVAMSEVDKQFKKYKVYPHFKCMEFDHTQKSFYSIDKDDKLFKHKFNGQSQFIAQLIHGQPKLMKFVNKRILIITYPYLQKFISVNVVNNTVEQIDCRSNQNYVTNILIINGKCMKILVTYASHIFAIYNYDFKEQLWQMNSYSKEHMMHSPLNVSLLKDPIRGAITDNQDSKRMLLFTNNHFIRLHQRGVPPKEVKEQEFSKMLQPEKKDSGQKLDIVDNYALIYHNYVILNCLNVSNQNYILLEWDKQATFSQIQGAFDGKKYKR